MKSYEHRAVGQAAAGGALVQVGGDSSEQCCVLRFGDVVALSGDYLHADDLFRLAAIPGDQGTKIGTRDEVTCALKVMAVDEGVLDDRFEPARASGDLQVTASAGATDVERRVRNRYLTLAAANGDHFVALPAWQYWSPGRWGHGRWAPLFVDQPLRVSGHRLSPPASSCSR